MNIYATEGQKVRYLGENGYDCQRENIEKLGVQPGDVLTVEYTEVGSWNTDVDFKEIPYGHNSVMFEDIEDTDAQG